MPNTFSPSPDGNRLAIRYHIPSEEPPANGMGERILIVDAKGKILHEVAVAIVRKDYE